MRFLFYMQFQFPEITLTASFACSSYTVDPYKYNALPPLPAQRNLTPPPTLYPQQPMSTPDNYNIPRFALTASQEFSSARSKRMDINV